MRTSLLAGPASVAWVMIAVFSRVSLAAPPAGTAPVSASSAPSSSPPADRPAPPSEAQPASTTETSSSPLPVEMPDSSPATQASPAAPPPSAELDAVPQGPVDVRIQEPAPPRRYVTIEWNPVPLLTMHTGTKPDPRRPTQGGVGKLSFNVVIAPLEHHAIIVSPYYVLTRTTPVQVWDDDLNTTQLPVQTFEGFGTELGYRYYTGRGGIRGVFFGPSLIVSSFTATAENGSKTHYVDYGGAADVGYQALVVDRLSLSIGAGVQYTRPSKSIPEQMLWAKVFANSVVLPRVLVSVGWAL